MEVVSFDNKTSSKAIFNTIKCRCATSKTGLRLAFSITTKGYHNEYCDYTLIVPDDNMLVVHSDNTLAVPAVKFHIFIQTLDLPIGV